MGADGENVFGRYARKTLAETGERRERAFLHLGRKGAVGRETARKPHGFLAVEEREKAVFFEPGDFKTKAVASEVHDGEEVCGRHGLLRGFVFLEPDERVGKRAGAEGLKVVKLFADADEVDRKGMVAPHVGDGHEDAAVPSSFVMMRPESVTDASKAFTCMRAF